MLVLSRKAGQGIMIGDDIEILITRVDSDTVKVGIQAPKSLTIFRNEVYKQIKENNLGALRKGSGQTLSLKLPPKPSDDGKAG